MVVKEGVVVPSAAGHGPLAEIEDVVKLFGP